MLLMLALLGVTIVQDAQAFYNPSTGRWLSRDPSGENTVDGPNIFASVANNSVNRFDTDGRTGWGPPFFPPPQPAPPPINCNGYGRLYPASCTGCDGKSKIDWYPGKARSICEGFASQYTGTAIQREAACVASCLQAAEAACQAASKDCDSRNCCRLAAHVKCYASCGFVPYRGLPPGGAGVGWNDLLPSVGRKCAPFWGGAGEAGYPIIGP